MVHFNCSTTCDRPSPKTIVYSKNQFRHICSDKIAVGYSNIQTREPRLRQPWVSKALLHFFIITDDAYILNFMPQRLCTTKITAGHVHEWKNKSYGCNCSILIVRLDFLKPSFLFQNTELLKICFIFFIFQRNIRYWINFRFTSIIFRIYIYYVQLSELF